MGNEAAVRSRAGRAQKSRLLRHVPRHHPNREVESKTSPKTSCPHDRAVSVSMSPKGAWKEPSLGRSGAGARLLGREQDVAAPVTPGLGGAVAGGSPSTQLQRGPCPRSATPQPSPASSGRKTATPAAAADKGQRTVTVQAGCPTQTPSPRKATSYPHELHRGRGGSRTVTRNHGERKQVTRPREQRGHLRDLLFPLGSSRKS